MKPPTQFWIFLLKNSNTHLDQNQLEEQADYSEIPLRLIMHGVPEKLVKHATPDQLMIMLKIVTRDMDQQAIINANHISELFGGSNQ